jgi:hypothetical protein
MLSHENCESKMWVQNSRQGRGYTLPIKFFYPPEVLDTPYSDFLKRETWYGVILQPFRASRFTTHILNSYRFSAIG